MKRLISQPTNIGGMFLILLFGVFIHSFSQAKERPVQATTDDCVLTVGLADWLPYQHFTQKGQAAGIQVDLVNQIAKLAGCELRYIPIKFSKSIKRLEKGSIDLMFNATVTAERRDFALFSHSYRQEMLVLYSTKKYAEECRNKSIKELIQDGFKMGLQKESLYGKAVSEVQKIPELNQKIVYFDHTAHDFDWVYQNNLDGFIDDPAIVSYRSRKEGEIGRLHACQLTVSSPVSLMFSKKTVSQSIVNEFNKAIDTVKQSDSYRNLWSL